MLDRQRFIEAVASSELYSPSVRKVLQELIRISVHDIANASAKYLIDATGVSTTVVYGALKELQKDEVIDKLNTQAHSYKLNLQKLNYIDQLRAHKNR